MVSISGFQALNGDQPVFMGIGGFIPLDESVITGTYGDNVIKSTARNDLIRGGRGNDTIHGDVIDRTFTKGGDLPYHFDLHGDLTNLIVGDFDGDGFKDDFIRQEKGRWDDDANNTAHIFIGQGNGTFTKQNLTEADAMKGDLTNLFVGDFNNDKKDDFIRQEKGGWASDNTDMAKIYFSNLRNDISDDTLYGDLDNDILAGGKGTNSLWGGEGQDTFVTEAGGIQIIKDFERGVDQIDMAQAQVNQISFDYAALPGSTIIKVNGTERARVEGSLVDSSSLINTSKDIKPETLTPAQVKNISAMLQKWAESYATSLELSTNNVQLVNNKLQMVGGDLTFIDFGTEQTQTNQGLQIESMTRNASMFFRNNSTESSSVTFSYSDGKGYEVSNQDTTQWETGNTFSIGGSVKVAGKTGIPFVAEGSVEVTVETSYAHSWSNGGSNTKINTDNVNTQQNTSIQFNAPAGAVTKAIATATGGEYSGGKYEIPFTISGTIGIDLNGDGDALDTNEINNLPVNAILQYYNPQQFAGEGFQRTFTLPQGQVLLYNETTQAKVTGTADGAFFTSVNASTASAYDWSLTNPTTSEYVNGVNYQAQFNTGNAVGQAVEERYWLIRNSEYGPRPSGTTLRIEGFTPAEDFIGIDDNAIKSEANIMLATGVGVGIDPADKLILKAGRYTQGNITFQTTQILMGGTGSDLTTIDDNDVLAELIGVAPHQLLGSSSRESLTRGDMTSNFMFGTQGTIWDNSLNSSGDGTNLLQLLQTV
ncbi:ETX/MTX2 family pore-forming toxin [Nodularia sphaerocarpa]|uniref:ETX/MTX2 family pore-forming toxin n=1 Tax=Nodularia sphaerocarpa TaxID=137816 RepID=UPI001EFB2FA2|nr:ETX/MTX2 family pore-forming toxin [Nodularia sphaerocarpa]MDB9372651.1 FG-GAP-like repeat-containing protein [Nodularia sphaerocarpa CS-585]MDB9377043.1 FG-GAP-like repeat-containing protein [Nodularia sphaerocarpa CS-585A2]ULP71157.1 Serralysin [Nodularia sphaerocarpa UHCC 0038]